MMMAMMMMMMIFVKTVSYKAFLSVSTAMSNLFLQLNIIIIIKLHVLSAHHRRSQDFVWGAVFS